MELRLYVFLGPSKVFSYLSKYKYIIISKIILYRHIFSENHVNPSQNLLVLIRNNLKETENLAVYLCQGKHFRNQEVFIAGLI